ncbi:MAG: Holliday junction branch migration protein RuvA [Planctomycetes bacterium]|nr:Holliday junction branch migration protein RuvA [Planctomycetota bacterium]
MYEYLEGQVAGRSAARLVLDVHGIGFDLAVPLGSAFPASGVTRVWTHYVVREDAQLLYGFPDRPARDLFRALLEVRGVGPAVALALLSGLSRDDLVRAIVAGDAKRLCAVKGIGKRTADQILLDLGERAHELAAELGVVVGNAVVEVTPPEPPREIQDAIAALVSIGYGESEARVAIEKARKKTKSTTLEALVRAALQG